MREEVDLNNVLSQNARKVLEKRYLKKDIKGLPIETAEDMFRRVAKNIASADAFYGKSQEEIALTENVFFETMTALRFLPNSPTLMNAGRDLQQLSACFVLPINDSMESIFETIKDAALVHKSGGGTGFSFSRLRAKNSPVRSTGGISSGPVSFMKVYNSATQAVKQGGIRRGANMGILRVDHPDILEFITCKERDKEITNFNISVAVTEDFMKKAAAGEDYELIDPKTKKVAQRLNAKDVFDLIVKMAHKNGEPGIIFLDRINKDNPTPKVGEIESTNPCVTGDSLVTTEFGLMRMKDMAGRFPDGGVAVLTDDRIIQMKYGALEEEGGVATLVKQGVGLSTISKAWRSGVKETMVLTTESGYELVATPDHKVMTTEGWVMIKDLKIGVHKVLIQSGGGRFNPNEKLPFDVQNEYTGDNGRAYRFNLPDRWTKQLGQVMGYMLGDGWLRDGDKDCRVGMTFSHEDEPLLTYIRYIMNSFYGSSVKEVKRENGVYHLSYYSKYFVDFFKRLGIKPWQADEKEVPESIFTATEDGAIGFLQGLFTADGTVNFIPKQSSYVRLTSKSKKLLKGVQLLLLNLGIKSRIYDRTRKERYGFEYVSKAGVVKKYKLDGICFELEISRDAVLIFLNRIGFLCGKHDPKVQKFYTKQYYPVSFMENIKDIRKNKSEEVYDLTEPFSSSFICNGLCISNCGEQPLLPYESCNLGSINLARMVTDGKIDRDMLEETAKVAVHFLDNVIDMNAYPLKKIEEMTKANRKIGLGVMGFADMLVMLGIRYNSEEAVAMAEEVMGFILEKAMEESRRLAAERGPFPNFKGSMYDLPGQAPLRNATLTTIAPAGTLSIIANCSSGIEPIFAISYVRNIMDNTKMIETHPYFQEIAAKMSFHSPELMSLIAEKGGVRGIDEVPGDIQNIFVTAHEVDPIWHIRMQAAFQKYTNNAVSKTVNFSKDATVEDVKEVYMLAYKNGCKGVTIYRDGSRDEQVLKVPSAGTDKDKRAQGLSIKIIPRPRPPVIRGTTTKIMTGCGSLYVTINEDEQGLPFEVFMQMGKAGGCAMSQLEAIGRLVSLALRSGIEISSIIEQLRGIRCPSPSWEKGGRIFSCSDAIARAVERRFVETKDKASSNPNTAVNDTRPQADEFKTDTSSGSVSTKTLKAGNIVGVCPDCGGALWHVEGCMICKSCGYSKCG